MCHQGPSFLFEIFRHCTSQVTFELRDLERTTSGPPGTNPKSKIVEKKEPPAPKVAAVKEEAQKEATTSSEQEPATAAASKE